MSALLWVWLFGCGDDGSQRTLTIVLPTYESTPSAEDDFVSARLRAFDTSYICTVADPDDDDSTGDEPALAEATWLDPLGSGSAPHVAVPSDRPITFVVEGFDADGALRLWGCDRDGDFVVELRRPCVTLDPAPACPFEGSCDVGVLACDGDGDVGCTQACSCTPFTLVDLEACECCSATGEIVDCPGGCFGGCPPDDMRAVCLDAACPDGTAVCIDGVAECFSPDEDADGYPLCDFADRDNDDCNDAIAAVHPGKYETCNGIDDDCDPDTVDGSIGDCGALGGGATCVDGACLCGSESCSRVHVACCMGECLEPQEVDGRCR